MASELDDLPTTSTNPTTTTTTTTNDPPHAPQCISELREHLNQFLLTHNNNNNTTNNTNNTTNTTNTNTNTTKPIVWTDSDLRRFLRARKWNVKKAAAMLERAVVWFDSPVSETVSTMFTPRTILDPVFDENEHVYADLMPHSNHGFDRSGRPVYWEKTGLITGRFKQICGILEPEILLVRHIRQQALMERRLVVASNRIGHAVEQQTVVMDLANMAYSIDPVAMGLFRRTIEIDDNYFPERLGQFIFINTPWIFKPLWAMIKAWIAPETAAKFCFLGSNYQEELQKFVDREFIPKEYGGDFEASYKWPYDVPVHELLGMNEADVPSQPQKTAKNTTDDAQELD